MATSATSASILSFDDAAMTTTTTTKQRPSALLIDENNNHSSSTAGSRVPGVTSLITPMSEGSAGSARSMLRARLKKLGEATKSKLVPQGLKLSSPRPIPRYLEVEISPLLLCGVFSLSDVASSRKEMERGYVKAPATGSIGAEKVSMSLPILHLQSIHGKRKKIIGWDKNQSEPLRVFIDTEGKTKLLLEYGIVGHDPDDVTPLGTVELPQRYKTLDPGQVHLNLKKRPLWPANNHQAGGGTRILNAKFRLSANARLSLQLTPKEATVGDVAAAIVAHKTESNLSMIDETDERKTVVVVTAGSPNAPTTSTTTSPYQTATATTTATTSTKASAVEPNHKAVAAVVESKPVVAAGPKSAPATRTTFPPTATATATATTSTKASAVEPSYKTATAVGPNQTLIIPTNTPAAAVAAAALLEESKPLLLVEPQTVAEVKTPGRKTVASLSNLFACLCGNNDKGVVIDEALQSSPKAREVSEPTAKALALPTRKGMYDIEENSLVETAPDVLMSLASRSSPEDDSLVETTPEVEKSPVVAPCVLKKPVFIAAEVVTKPITRSSTTGAPYGKGHTQSVPTPHGKHEYTKFVQPPDAKGYTPTTFNLPMSFSSTTGSNSGVSYSDTENATLNGLFCFPLMDDNDFDDDEYEYEVVDVDVDVDTDDDDDDSSVNEVVYREHQDSGKLTSRPESVSVSSVITEPMKPIDAVTTSLKRKSKPRTAPFLKQLIWAFKDRCGHPRIDEGLGSELGDNVASTYDGTWTDRESSDLVEMTSDESSSSMSTAPIDGCRL